MRHRPASIVQQFPGENPLFAAIVHDLYATQVLTGCREPARLSAQYHRTREGEVDLALAHLQWENGPLASFAASYLTPAGMAPRGFDRMEVFGDGWSARISPNPRPIEVWDAQGGHSRFQFEGVKENVGLKDDAFRFQPPAGVEVVTG